MNDLKLYNVSQLKALIQEYKELKELKQPALTKMKKDDLIHYILMKKIKFEALPPKVKNTTPLGKYNQKPNNEEEQKEYLKELNDNPRYSNPLKALKPYYETKTNKEVMTKLMPHQIIYI
jgi:hypothetical protein